MTSSCRWLQLEGSGEILTTYGSELGLKEGWIFEDIYSLDISTVIDTEVMNCVAFIVVAPINLLDQLTGTYLEEKEIIFIKQTIDNACGAIALLHALANCKDAAESPLLSELKQQSNGLTRGVWLEKNEEIRQIHQKYCVSGQSALPDLEADTDMHFVCITKQKDSILLLDGRREAPLRIATETETSDFVKWTFQTLSQLVSLHDAPNLALFALTNSMK